MANRSFFAPTQACAVERRTEKKTCLSVAIAGRALARGLEMAAMQSATARMSATLTTLLPSASRSEIS